jgi:2-(1,2-epoxy-1,2-dihydrophenyl)acetyl-CoA isomerase
MPDYQTLLFDVQEKVAWITLNRPDVLNAFNDEMTTELLDAFNETEKNEMIRSVVISGAGRGFCSGQDLKNHPGKEKRSLKDSLVRRYNPIIRKIRTIDKPVIAMINGVAAGAGCSLALACDLRLMSEKASLIEVFIRIGLVPDSGSHWFLVRNAGLARAFEFAALGDPIDSSLALSTGLVNRVFPEEKLRAETEALAGRLAKAPTKAIGLIKRVLNKSVHSDLDTILDYESYIQEIASYTEDYREGVSAFLEKRKPEFKGK